MFPSQPILTNNYMGSQPGSVIYYSNMEPYNNQTFLNTTFGFNEEYISAFHTLPHEQKLKFYISVEEMKMLGFMNDRPVYQSILKEISRRYNIIKKTETPNNKQNSNDGKGNNIKEDIWGAKLEHLCEDHLKKIQKDNLLEDLPIGMTFDSHFIQPNQDLLSNEEISESLENSQKQNKYSNKVENQEDEFEWAEEEQQQKNFSIFPSNQNAQEDTAFSKNITHKYSNPIANNNHESITTETMLNYQKHNSLPLYLPTNQPTQQVPIDVWDLQIIEDEPDKIKNIIYNSKTHLPPADDTNTQNKSINSQISPKIQQEKQRNFDLMNDHNNFQENNIIKSQTITENINQPFDFMATSSVSQYQYQNQQKNIPTIKLVESQKSIPSNNPGQDDDQFQWQQNQSAEPNNQIQQMLTVSASSIPIQNNLTVQDHQIQNNSVKENNNAFDLNFFGLDTYPIKETVSIAAVPYSYTQPQINNFGISNSQASQDFQSSFGFDLNGLNLGKNEEYIENEGDQVSDFSKKHSSLSGNIGSMMSSTMFSTINTSILDPLKKFPTSDKVVAALKKKVFDFDRHFYQQALQLIQTLGYQNSPDYTYIKDQSNVCQEIYNLSEAFSAAVEEDTEEMVARNLKKCKQLYTQLDANKTATITKKYLMMDGQTLSFKMGKMALESGISPELLEKNINSPKFNQITTVLYVMSFLGTIHTTSTLASQIIQYIEFISDQIEEIKSQINNFDKQVSDIVQNSDLFKQYLLSIKTIATKAQQLINLGKLSTKDDFYYNAPKFLEKLSSLSSFSPSSQLIPNYYVTFLCELSNGTHNIYSMHKQMREFLEQHPLCSICYQSLQPKEQGNEGAKRDDGNFYHFKCWNLKVHVTKFKNTQMQNITDNIKSSKLFTQEIQQNSNQNQSISTY